MTKHHIIKIGFLILGIAIYFYRQKLKKRNEISKTLLEENDSDIKTQDAVNENPIKQNQEIEIPKTFYSINDGNQELLIYAPEYDKEWFEKINLKYSWDKFDEYDNKFWEYMYQLFDTLYEIAQKTENGMDFFTNLNREQKVFYSLLSFTGDTDNGGVTQFFFNKPEFAFAVLETFEELKLEKLKTDYEKCLNEFIGTSNSYSKRKEIFSNSNLNWEKRWKAFTDGYDDIKSAETLEDYFYDTEFKKVLYKTFVEYADKNMKKFVRK